jgi:hypothetical protein
VSGIEPADGLQGTSVPVTLTGANFDSNLTVAGGEGFAAGPVSLIESTKAATILTIDAAAAPGSRSVTVTTATGVSNAVAFDVQAASPPTLSGIAPGSGQQGTSVPVTLTGTGFIAGLSIDAGPDVSVRGVSIAADRQSAPAVFGIGIGAASGNRAVAVATAAGMSNTVPFAVQQALAPALTGITPYQGSHGTTVPVTQKGVNQI